MTGLRVYLNFSGTCLLISLTCTGQESYFREISADSLKSLFITGVSYNYGFIIAHSEAVENTVNSFPQGSLLEFTWHKRNQKIWNSCNCFPRTGFLFSYYNFDNTILGSGYTAAWIVEPFFSVRHRINLSLRAAAGLSYLTNPHHLSKNPNNNSYSTSVNPYLYLGLISSIQIHKNWQLRLSANYNHNSNGGVREPNKGINWPTAGAGIEYSIKPFFFPQHDKRKNKDFKKDPIRFDVAPFASSRTIDPVEKTRYFVYGLSINASLKLNNLNAVSAGSEIIVDYALRERLLENGKTGTSYIRSGFLAGHEFLMGKFIFSQQLGVYMYSPSAFYDDVYQRWGLSYRFGKNFLFGINLLSHRHIANFLDYRFAYTIPLLKKIKNDIQD